MSNNTNKQELPDSVCLAKEKKEADNALRQAVKGVQGAYKALVGIAELSPVSTDLKDLTSEWLRGKIDKRIELVKADMSLTEDERTTRLNAWSSLRARASRYINVIKAVMEKWSSAKWVYDPDIQNLFCSNIDNVTEGMATHKVGDEARTHWRMIQECLQKVRELRAWEDSHDVKSQMLANLQCLTAEAFAEMWIRGDAKFDRATASKYGFEVGNFHDPRHPERVII